MKIPLWFLGSTAALPWRTVSEIIAFWNKTVKEPANFNSSISSPNATEYGPLIYRNMTTELKSPLTKYGQSFMKVE